MTICSIPNTIYERNGTDHQKKALVCSNYRKAPDMKLATNTGKSHAVQKVHTKKDIPRQKIPDHVALEGKMQPVG